jgi:hypothetical protein
MNDALWSNEVEPEPGVIGRAFTPGGGERRKQVLDTGIKASQLAGGGTLMAWAKVGAEDSKAFAPIFSAGRTLVVQCPVRDNAWHHVVVTFPPGGADSRLFVDGVDRGAAGLKLPTADASLEIGSAGDRYLSGLIDEVRIYDRVLDPAEIEATYRREAIRGNLIRP